MNVNYIHVVVIHMILMCLVHLSTGYSSRNKLLLQFRFQNNLVAPPQGDCISAL